MSDRTKEQVEADEALVIAIEECIKAYANGDELAERMVLGNYVVLTSIQRIENGIVQTAYPMFMPNGDIPWYGILGLIEMHKILVHTMISAGNDNG